MNELERSLLVLLYEKYKNSKKETGSNIITRRTKISPNVLYKDYNANTADIDKIEVVDNAVKECSKLGFVTVERAPNGKEIKNIYLIDGMINELENYLQSKCGYETKDVKRNFIINLLNKYDNKTPAASAECNKLRKMLEANKYPSRYHQKEELLKSLVFIENNKQDLFLREASLRIFGDSKYFEENVLKLVCKSLRDYLNRPRAEDEVDEEILEEYGIITDKQKICLKGNIVLKIDGKLFDVNVLKGGLMIFNDDVCRIEQIAVNTDNFITIENYTSWCRFAKKDTVCLYLGGYANRYQRDFLKKIYLDNPNLKFFHFGDIDAGGFYIFNDLCRKTGIDFSVYKMSVQELMDARYRTSFRKLTNNDKTRLISLKDDSVFKEVIKYMLDNDVKLEQEIISFYESVDNG